MIMRPCARCCGAVSRGGLAEQALPDLLLIDGGRGQLGVVAAVLAELGPGSGRSMLVGMAKSRVKANVRGQLVERSEERLFRPGRKNPVTPAARVGGAVPAGAAA